MRTIGKTSGRLALVAALLMAGATCLLAAPAESGHVAPVASASHNASNTPAMTFEVVSIRPSKPGTNWAQGPGLLPDGFRQSGVSIGMMILTAYDPEPPIRWGSAKLLNAPGWVGQDMYDIDTRVASEDVEAWQKQDKANPALLRSALQATLKERCHLTLHTVPSQIPYLDLVIGKHGLKIKETPPDEVLPKGGFTFANGKMIFEDRNGAQVRHLYGVTMKEFATLLTLLSRDRPVQDKTGLTGRYDFTWQKQDSAGNEGDPGGQLYKWPIGNLGLALKPGVGPSSVFVVDHIDKPSPN